MAAQITLPGINGITVIKDSCFAFYKILNHKVELVKAYDKTGITELPGNTELYKYFKNREKQLTRFYGARYCPVHSTYAYAFCNRIECIS
jgi:hypothetical protein